MTLQDDRPMQNSHALNSLSFVSIIGFLFEVAKHSNIYIGFSKNTLIYYVLVHIITAISVTLLVHRKTRFFRAFLSLPVKTVDLGAVDMMITQLAQLNYEIMHVRRRK